MSHLDLQSKYPTGQLFFDAAYTLHGKTKIVPHYLETLKDKALLDAGTEFEALYIERSESYYAAPAIRKRGKVPVFVLRDDWIKDVQ